jgi:hypothetical protein
MFISMTQEQGKDHLKENGRIGTFLGKFLAPLTALGSKARHARLFHPEGMVFRAEVVPLAEAGSLGSLAERLKGEACVRLSGAWWRGGKEWKDVLGCAIRFTEDSEHEQDLLFATIRKPWTTLLAPLSTDTHDFLENDYYAVSPFEVKGVGKVKWRLVANRSRSNGRNRWQKIIRAVGDDLAFFRLELLELNGSKKEWQRVAEVRLKEKMDIDQEALRFSPYRNGLGIEPRGLIHGLRIATYRSSQKARPKSEGEA